MTSSHQLETLRAIVEPQGLASDLSDLIDKLKEWASQLALNGLGKAALHSLYHYIVDAAWPKIKEQTPAYVDVLVDSFLIPSLTKIHDAIFGLD